MPLLDAYANFLKGRRRSSSELPKKQLYLTPVHSIYLLPCLIRWVLKGASMPRLRA